MNVTPVLPVTALEASSPLRGEPGARDIELARRATDGDASALEELLRAQQDWIFTIALRMLGDHATAADCTQEALVRLVTRIGQFEERSSFRTWAYRIVLRTVLDESRARTRARRDWDAFREEIDRLGTESWPDAPPEAAFLAEETRMRCMTGMLLCLDVDQRIVYVLCEMLEVPASTVAELLDLRAATVRKRLERARHDLARFVHDQCGLVRRSNPCRCAHKTRALVDAGLVDPERLVFARAGWRRARREAPALARTLGDAGEAVAAMMRDQPLSVGPDLATELRKLVASVSG